MSGSKTVTKWLAAALSLMALAVPGAAAAQQVLESVGARALGMGGAFVGVADDNNASFWNPGGMAVTKPGMTIGWVDFQTGKKDDAPQPGQSRRHSTFTSLGSAQLNVSYGSLQTTSLVTGTGGDLLSTTLKTSQYGVTFVQAVSDGVFVGVTGKLVRGYAASTGATNLTLSSALDQGASLPGNTVTRFDYDIGLMLASKYVRLGLVLKDLQEPSFADAAGTAIVLRRQARAGLSVLPTNGLTLAMDLDLDTVDLRDGLRRIIALGAEDRMGQRFALRGGMRWSLKGERRRVGSFGASWALKKAYWIDGQYTLGEFGGDRGFGVSLRIGA